MVLFHIVWALLSRYFYAIKHVWSALLGPAELRPFVLNLIL
jgi:hypothetical protein